MQFINLTPHTINILGREISASGVVARLEEKTGPVPRVVDGIAIHWRGYGNVVGLPCRQDGTIYVTSLIVAQAASRSDVVYPGDLIRDDEGKIVGCSCFCCPDNSAVLHYQA